MLYISRGLALLLFTLAISYKIISRTGKFVFFLIHYQSNGNIMATSMAPGKGSSMEKNKVDMVVEECTDIFSSLTVVPLYYQVNHLIDLTPKETIPNRLIYHRSILENEEIK